jgi:hypothetical protein
MITPAQCRAARGWLDISQSELGKLINRSDVIVRQFELGKRAGLLDEAMLALALQNVLERLGMKFADHSISGP